MHALSSVISLRVSPVIVDPVGRILLLEKQGSQEDESSVLELPGKDIACGNDWRGINVRRQIVRQVSQSTKIQVSQLATDVYTSGMVQETSSNSKRGCSLILCAGITCVAFETIQIDYDKHTGYRWLNRTDLEGPRVLVADTTIECIRVLFENTDLFQSVSRGDRVW